LVPAAVGHAFAAQYPESLPAFLICFLPSIEPCGSEDAHIDPGIIIGVEVTSLVAVGSLSFLSAAINLGISH